MREAARWKARKGEPMDAAAKRACKLFCRLATTACARGLGTGDPERSEGARPNKKYNQLIFVSNKPSQTEKMIEDICLLQPKLDNASASHIYFIGQ